MDPSRQFHCLAADRRQLQNQPQIVGFIRNRFAAYVVKGYAADLFLFSDGLIVSGFFKAPNYYFASCENVFFINNNVSILHRPASAFACGPDA